MTTTLILYTTLQLLNNRSPNSGDVWHSYSHYNDTLARPFYEFLLVVSTTLPLVLLQISWLTLSLALLLRLAQLWLPFLPTPLLHDDYNFLFALYTHTFCLSRMRLGCEQLNSCRDWNDEKEERSPWCGGNSCSTMVCSISHSSHPQLTLAGVTIVRETLMIWKSSSITRRRSISNVKDVVVA